VPLLCDSGVALLLLTNNALCTLMLVVIALLLVWLREIEARGLTVVGNGRITRCDETDATYSERSE
jgi:hypothetical protein